MADETAGSAPTVTSAGAGVIAFADELAADSFTAADLIAAALSWVLTRADDGTRHLVPLTVTAGTDPA